MVQLMNLHTPQNLPMITVGDFNADSAKAVMQFLVHQTPVTYYTTTIHNPVELDDSWYVANPTTNKPATVGTGSSSIDWILTNPATNVTTAIIDDQGVNPSGDYPSDHLPLMINFSVEDVEDPNISCPADTTVSAQSTSCEAAVSYTLPTTSDNNPGEVLSLTSGIGSGGNFPVGTSSEVYTVTDLAGNTASCSFDVIVDDVTQPIAICQGITISVDGADTVNIDPSAVDDSSSDACGIASLLVAPSSFYCENIQLDNSVVLKVTDLKGNSATCEAQVSVILNGQQVNGNHKISALQGSFSEPLDQKDYFGSAVAYIGDVNGDGIIDMAVGAKGDDDGLPGGKKGKDHGAVYILFLNSSSAVSSYQKISAAAGGFVGPLDKKDLFGSGIAGIGDIDNDGTPDIVVGATGDDDGSNNSKGKDHGAIYIIKLNADGTVKASNKVSADSGSLALSIIGKKEKFGSAIASLGDIDGDGCPDIAVGAFGAAVFSPLAGKNKKGVGAVYIINLTTSGQVKSYTRISTDSLLLDSLLDQKDRFGRSVANMGDFSGDGINDLIVGADQDDDGQGGTKSSNSGAVYVITLSSGGTAQTVNKISANSGNLSGALGKKDQFGSSVAGIGDLDSDGTPDIAIGAVLDDDPEPGDKGKDQGAIYTLFLNPDGTVKTESKISAALSSFPDQLNQKDNLGYSLASTSGSCKTNSLAEPFHQHGDIVL